MQFLGVETRLTGRVKLLCTIAEEQLPNMIIACGSLSFKFVSDVFPQRMLIDQSNYRVPKTLMVPQTEAQTGVETPCIPFNYNVHHPNTASGSKEGTEHRIF